MGRLQRPQNRKQRRSLNRYRCSVCMYASSRRYNIVRHEIRIHSTSARPRKCCDILLKTKGEYYLHCEINHPNSRPTNVTSRNKYKILPNIVISQSPSKSTFVTSSPKKSQEIPYMLRSRVRPKIYVDEAKIEFVKSASPKLLKLAYESELEDVQAEDTANVQQSSGYGTKTSINWTFDSTKESCKIKLSHPEERDECEAPAVEEQLSCLNDTSEKPVEESNEPPPIEFCNNDQTTAVKYEDSVPEFPKTFDEFNVTLSEELNNVIPSEKLHSEENENPAETMNLTVTRVHPEKIDSKELDTSESVDIKSTGENEFKPNCNTNTLSTSAACNLPQKKRILQSLGFSNHENIVNARKPMGDRLCLAKSLNLQEEPLRKKHHLSKKMKYRKLRKSINLSRYYSASSDAENVSPLAAPTRKQKAPGLEVDLRADGRFTWDEITRLMREHLQPIDFDSFKAIPRCNGQSCA